MAVGIFQEVFHKSGATHNEIDFGGVGPLFLMWKYIAYYLSVKNIFEFKYLLKWCVLEISIKMLVMYLRDPALSVQLYGMTCITCP